MKSFNKNLTFYSFSADLPVELQEQQLPEAVTITERPHRIEPSMSMESDHGVPEYDEAKQEPSLVDTSQHREATYESVTEVPQPEKKVMPPELKTAQDFEEFEDESARDTRSIPIQRVVTSELAGDEYTTAESQQQSGKLADLTDESGERPEGHVTEIHADVHQDFPPPRREEIITQVADKEDQLLTEPSAAAQETRIHYEEQPQIHEVEERTISHEQEFVKEPTISHEIEASLQEFPSIQHTEDIESPDRHKREVFEETRIEHPAEHVTKAETPEIDIGTVGSDQAHFVPVHRTVTEQSFEEEGRDFIHSKSQLSDSPSEQSLKSEATVIHVRPDEISSPERETSTAQTSLDVSTPQDFTERQIVTPPEELRPDVQKTQEQLIYEQEVGAVPEYSTEELHFEAKQTPEPTTFDVRQVESEEEVLR